MPTLRRVRPRRSSPRTLQRARHRIAGSPPVQRKSIEIPPVKEGLRQGLEFCSVTQSVDEAIVITDAVGNIIFWNQGAETIFGYAERSIIGKRLALLIPAHTGLLRGSRLPHVLFSKASPIDSRTHELRGIRADGREFPAELSLLTWKFGPKVFFTTIIRDITDRKRLQKEILEISAREQQRIGQDLHDDLCQHLTAISFLGEALEQKLSAQCPEGAGDVREMTRLVEQATVQTKLLAKGLLPVEIDAQGLTEALHEMAANTRKLTRVACRMEKGKPVPILDETVAVHLYRIAQEAVNNALRHAHSKNIVVRLSKADGWITLSVADDGVGISKDAVHKGLGLSIMHSRAETIGATLEIRRGAQWGTVVTCSLRPPPRLVSRKGGRRVRHR